MKRMSLFALAAAFWAAEPSPAQSNAKVKVTEAALTKLVAALGARGSTQTLSWSVASPSIQIQPSGVRLRGTLIARPKKTLLNRNPSPVRRPVRGTRLPTRLGTIRQSFSLPLSISISGNSLRVRLKNQLVAIKNAQGKKLSAINLSPFYNLQTRLGLPRFTVQGSSFWPQLKEMVLQRGAGHLMLSTRVDL